MKFKSYIDLQLISNNINLQKKTGIMINAIKQRRKMMQRRKHSLFKKAYKLKKLCNADVAVIVYKNGCFYIHKSIDQKAWPLSIEQIANLVPFFTFNTEMLIKITNYISATGNCTSKTLRSLNHKVLYKKE